MTKRTEGQDRAVLETALKEFDAVRSKMSVHEIAILGRLAKSTTAAKALATLQLDAASGGVILEACLLAAELARTFKSRVGHEKSLLSRDRTGYLTKLDKSVADLRIFIRDLNRDRADGLSASIKYSQEDIDSVTRGLYVLSDAIQKRREVAKQTLLRWGTTRKTNDRGKAGITAAIGYIAEAVRYRCGQPHWRAVADLAEVVLKCGEVSVERVREAERTRHRRWR
jgi:hypothetical protein